MNTFRLARFLAVCAGLCATASIVTAFFYSDRVPASWALLAVAFVFAAKFETDRVRKSRRTLRPLKMNLHRIGIRVTKEYADAYLLAETGVVNKEGKIT